MKSLPTKNDRDESHLGSLHFVQKLPPNSDLQHNTRPELAKPHAKPQQSTNGMANTFAPGLDARTVRSADGNILNVPDGWELLPPGDAALTRRVKAAGDHWIVQEKKGRKLFSRGVWALAETIERVRAELEAERSTESFAKRKLTHAKRREKVQGQYVEDFTAAVVAFLARLVGDHATPVGSGTVARTKRIPVEQRAEAAVIAWMRHQTTAYDSMAIPPVKGKRREVRRLLAERSKELLQRYRGGEVVSDECPLKMALASG